MTADPVRALDDTGMRLMRGASAAGLARRAWRRASPDATACSSLIQEVVVRRI